MTYIGPRETVFSQMCQSRRKLYIISFDDNQVVHVGSTEVFISGFYYFNALCLRINYGCCRTSIVHRLQTLVTLITQLTRLLSFKLPAYYTSDSYYFNAISFKVRTNQLTSCFQDLLILCTQLPHKYTSNFVC